MSDQPDKTESITRNVHAIDKDLNDLIGYNSSIAINEEALETFFFNNAVVLKSLMYEFATSLSNRLTVPVDKYIVHVEKRGRDWKAFIVNNAFGVINIHNFISNNIKPFNMITNNGLRYLEFSADSHAVKILLIHYERSSKVPAYSSEFAKDPNVQGQGYHHIHDVFNIMQDKSTDIATCKEMRFLTDSDVDVQDTNGLLINIIRASTYMFRTAYQTVSISDSIYLDKAHPENDDEAIHRRCAAFYTPGQLSDGLLFTNFRNQLTYKNKNKNFSKTVCNHIGACFGVTKEESGEYIMSRLNYITLQPSIGCSIEMNWR